MGYARQDDNISKLSVHSNFHVCGICKRETFKSSLFPKELETEFEFTHMLLGRGDTNKGVLRNLFSYDTHSIDINIRQCLVCGRSTRTLDAEILHHGTSTFGLCYISESVGKRPTIFTFLNLAMHCNQYWTVNKLFSLYMYYSTYINKAQTMTCLSQNYANVGLHVWADFCKLMPCS